MTFCALGLELAGRESCDAAVSCSDVVFHATVVVVVVVAVIVVRSLESSTASLSGF